MNANVIKRTAPYVQTIQCMKTIQSIAQKAQDIAMSIAYISHAPLKQIRTCQSNDHAENANQQYYIHTNRP